MTPSSVTTFPAIEDLLPHRGSNLLLEEIVDADSSSIIVNGRVPSSGWYLQEDGGMPLWIGIELMAQAMAAHIGLENWRQGAPVKPGMLIGCRSFRMLIPALRASERFRVSAMMVYRDDGGFAAYDCTISGTAGELAKATLKAYLPENFEDLMKKTLS